MAEAPRDGNYVPTMLFESSTTPGLTIAAHGDQTTGRLFVDLSGGAGTVTSVSVVTANGVSGSVANPTTTPAITLTLGAITPSSVVATGTIRSNTGLIVEETGAGTDTITIQAPASIAASYTLTLPVDDGTNGQVLSTDGSGVLAWLDAGGTGTVTTVSVVTANGVSGSVANPTTTPAITLTLGAITPTTVNGLTISTTTGTFTLSNGKTFVVTAGLTLSGTDSTVMTFPTTSATIARTDAANTFVGASTASAWVLTSPTITTSIVPTNDDGAALGSTSKEFSDLFLASGGVINWANGNATLTHSTGLLTINVPLTLGTSNSFTAGTIELGAASDTTISRSSAGVIAVESVVIPSISSTNTLTNKRITPRVLSAASYTTDTGSSIDSDAQDMFIVTAQTGALKFNNPSGTPTDGQKLIITVASSTTSARALTWDTAYGSTTVTLPTTTAATTATLSIGFIWSASKSLWQCVAVA